MVYVLETDASLNSTYKQLNSFYNHKNQSSLFFLRQGCFSLNLPWLELHKASNRAEQVRASPRYSFENPSAFHYHRLSREFEPSPYIFSLLSLNPAAYFHAAHHFEYFPGSLPGLGDSGRRSISRGGRGEWCRCRDLNAGDAMLLREAFRASFAPSSFSHLSALNSSSLLFTVTEAVSL